MLLLSIHNVGRPPLPIVVTLALDGENECPARTAPRILQTNEIELLPFTTCDQRKSDRTSRSRRLDRSTCVLEDCTISLPSAVLPQHRITTDSPPTRKQQRLSLITGISQQAFVKMRGGRKEPNKHVTFSDVQIREHAITVGDHDWCQGSLPIQLDWQHTMTHSIPIDDFEWLRERQGRTPRGRLPKLDHTQRKRRLRRVAGITEEDLFLLERQHIDSKYIALQCSKTVTLFPSQREVF